jgi:3-deoxy-D-manno-octulosonic-acid transferase
LLDTFWGGFIPSLGVRMFCAQNEVYAKRLLGLGIAPDCVRVTGSMKYDGLRTAVDASRQRALCEQLGLTGKDLVFVAASTHDDEETQVCEIFPAIVKEFPGARLVIVPRHVERAEAVTKAVAKAGLRPVRKTELSGKPADGDWRTVPIVDTMGELIDIMALATVVFVGKSISAENRGGHNMLEPAALGKPAIFGPHVANFQSEADFLLSNGAARQVHGKNGLRDACLEFFRSAELRAEMGRKAAGLIAQNQGATQRNVAVIAEILQNRK